MRVAEQGRLYAACSERWGRVGRVEGCGLPNTRAARAQSLHRLHEQHKLRGSYDKLAAQSSLVSPKTSPSSLYWKVAAAVHA